MFLPISRMVIAVSLFVLLITGTACSDITEQEIVFDAGLYAVSPEDFSIISSFQDMSSPRCLMIYPGRIFAASTEGRVYCYDSETYSLIDSYIVGTGSPAGYHRMVFSPAENSAYLIGATGKILELSMPDCQVTDEFLVGPFPADLCITSGSPGYLWVVDSSANRLYPVKLNGNTTVGSYSLSEVMQMTCMEPFYSPDSLMLGTSNGAVRVILQPSGALYTKTEKGGYYHSITAIPDRTYFATVIGTDPGVLAIQSFTSDTLIPDFNPVLLEGNFHFSVPGNDNNHLYVLSSLGNGQSRLTSYSYITGNVLMQKDFEGFPLDLKVSGSGMIYVLTYE